MPPCLCTPKSACRSVNCDSWPRLRNHGSSCTVSVLLDHHYLESCKPQGCQKAPIPLGVVCRRATSAATGSRPGICGHQLRAGNTGFVRAESTPPLDYNHDPSERIVQLFSTTNDTTFFLFSVLYPPRLPKSAFPSWCCLPKSDFRCHTLEAGHVRSPV